MKIRMSFYFYHPSLFLFLPELVFMIDVHEYASYIPKYDNSCIPIPLEHNIIRRGSHSIEIGFYEKVGDVARAANKSLIISLKSNETKSIIFESTYLKHQFAVKRNLFLWVNKTGEILMTMADIEENNGTISYKCRVIEVEIGSNLLTFYHRVKLEKLKRTTKLVTEEFFYIEAILQYPIPKAPSKVEDFRNFGVVDKMCVPDKAYFIVFQEKRFFNLNITTWDLDLVNLEKVMTYQSIAKIESGQVPSFTFMSFFNNHSNETFRTLTLWISRKHEVFGAMVILKSINGELSWTCAIERQKFGTLKFIYYSEGESEYEIRESSFLQIEDMEVKQTSFSNSSQTTTASWEKTSNQASYVLYLTVFKGTHFILLFHLTKIFDFF